MCDVVLNTAECCSVSLATQRLRWLVAQPVRPPTGSGLPLSKDPGVNSDQPKPPLRRSAACISRIVSVQFPFHLGPLLERQPDVFDRLVADLGGKRWATPPLIVNVKPKDIRVFVGRSHDENLHQPPPKRPLAVIPEVLPTRHAATVALPTWTLLLEMPTSCQWSEHLGGEKLLSHCGRRGFRPGAVLRNHPSKSGSRSFSRTLLNHTMARR